MPFLCMDLFFPYSLPNLDEAEIRSILDGEKWILENAAFKCSELSFQKKQVCLVTVGPLYELQAKLQRLVAKGIMKASVGQAASFQPAVSDPATHKTVFVRPRFFFH